LINFTKIHFIMISFKIAINFNQLIVIIIVIIIIIIVIIMIVIIVIMITFIIIIQITVQKHYFIIIFHVIFKVI